MPNDNQNNNQDDNQSVSTPPIVVSEDVLPPMEQGQIPPTTQSANTQIQQEGDIVNPSPSSDTQNMFGSASPNEDIKPSATQDVTTTSIPQKKFAGGRVIATILGLLLLVGGVGSGVFLVQQNQDVRERAGGVCGYCDSNNTCVSCAGGLQSVGECTSNSQCTPGSTANPLVCISGTTDEATCTVNGCSGTKTRTCNSSGTGWSNFGSCEIDDPNCGSTTNNSCEGKSVELFAQGRNTNAYSITVTQAMADACNNTCPGASLYASKCVCDEANPVGGCNTNCELISNVSVGQIIGFPSAPTCGSVQIDIGCKNSLNTYGTVAFASMTNAVSCGGTQTNPPSQTASCQNVRAYSDSWTLLTSANLASLEVGDEVNFCVTGTASAGNFNKARFTINSVLQAETTTKRPGSNDFCQLYTIPSGVQAFNVTAQINHETLGWK